MSNLKLNLNPPSATITLNRPERRNALTRELIGELIQAFRDLHLEKKVRAVILTGAESAFCAGMDLQQMQETASHPDSLEIWREDAVLYRELIEVMLQFPKPIIAAVNGPAVAGGAGLVLAADMAIATSSSKFGLPEPQRGIVAGLVAPLLAFRIGGGRAARLLLSAELMDADRMLDWGVYHELTDFNAIWAAAHAWAVQCGKSAPQAIQMTKQILNETIGEHLGVQLSAGAAASAAARTTDAAREGLDAFLEKREPQWW